MTWRSKIIIVCLLLIAGLFTINKTRDREDAASKDGEGEVKFSAEARSHDRVSNLYEQPKKSSNKLRRASVVEHRYVISDVRLVKDLGFLIVRAEDQHIPHRKEVAYIERLGITDGRLQISAVDEESIAMNFSHLGEGALLSNDVIIFSERRKNDERIWATENIEKNQNRVEQDVPPKSDRAGG